MDRLIALLRQLSVRHQRVILASGQESDFYVDARQTTLHPEGSVLIARAILARLRPDVMGVGGPTTGADPIAGAVAALSFLEGRPVQGFMVRKEAKGYGMKNAVEGRGPLPPGSPVCLVEDTVTTGGSLLRAIRQAEAEGLVVVQVIVVVDREEGAALALAEAGYTMEALTRKSELAAR